MSVSPTSTAADLVGLTEDGHRAALTASVETDAARIEAMWREAQERLVASPYQRYEIVRAWLDTFGMAEGARFVAVVGRDAQGVPGFLLPLAVTRMGPLRVASIVGGKHTNFCVPIFDPAVFAGNSRRIIAELLADSGERAGIDVYRFRHVPRVWNGAANPLAALDGQPCVNPAYRATLTGSGDDLLRALRGSSGLRKLRAKERKLAEEGRLAHLVATTPEDRARVIEAFHVQKAEWFAKTGNADVFSPPAARAYVAALAACDPKTFAWHALTLDDKVIATFGGMGHQGRFSTCINSYDMGEVAKHSPGEILLKNLIATVAADGHGTYDLGVGEADYKRHWLHEQEDMTDVFLGVGIAGVVAAPALAATYRAARKIKTSERLSGLLRRVRGGAPAPAKPRSDD